MLAEPRYSNYTHILEILLYDRLGVRIGKVVQVLCNQNSNPESCIFQARKQLRARRVAHPFGSFVHELERLDDTTQVYQP